MDVSSPDGVVAKQSSRAQVFPKWDERIRLKTRASIAYHAKHPKLIDARLADLEREWGIERWLQLNSATLSLVTLGVAALRGRRWLALTTVIQGFLAQHGVQGFCPPLVLLRMLGIRTTSEIEAERHALKALRGDFSGARQADVAAAATAPPAEAPPQRLPSSRGRVSRRWMPQATARIRRETEHRLALYETHPELRDRRLRELDREWDLERILEVEGPATTLTGVVLAATRGRRWLGLPAFAQSMMAVHALHGFYPLLPLLRRMGVRTAHEISEERYGIKALRGDFHRVKDAPPERRADDAHEAALPA